MLNSILKIWSKNSEKFFDAIFVTPLVFIVISFHQIPFTWWNAYIWHLGASSSPSSPDTIRRERRTNGKYRIAATVHCCCCCLLKTVLDRYKKIIKKKSSYMLTSFGFFLFNGSRQSVQKSHGFHLWAMYFLGITPVLQELLK